MISFFKNIYMLHNPTDLELVLFACDDNYFLKYGIYNTFSCNENQINLHVHLINPSKLTLDKIEKLKKILSINLSISYEKFDSSKFNHYALKSYYYSSRFFIALYLFTNYKIDSLHIVDADIIFNEKIKWADDVKLALDYNKHSNNEWQKVLAGYLFLRKEKKEFLEDFIAEYWKKYHTTNFNDAYILKDKIEKANITGLDQICLGRILEQKYNSDFFNIFPVKKDYKSKLKEESKIWVLVNKNKDSSLNYLQEYYKEYLEKL